MVCLGFEPWAAVQQRRYRLVTGYLPQVLQTHQQLQVSFIIFLNTGGLQQPKKTDQHFLIDHYTYQFHQVQILESITHAMKLKEESPRMFQVGTLGTIEMKTTIQSFLLFLLIVVRLKNYQIWDKFQEHLLSTFYLFNEDGLQHKVLISFQTFCCHFLAEIIAVNFERKFARRRNLSIFL